MTGASAVITALLQVLFRCSDPCGPHGLAPGVNVQLMGALEEFAKGAGTRDRLRHFLQYGAVNP